MPRVVHFEIGAEDLEKITNFYKNVFGWTITKFNGGEMEYWLVKTGEGGSGIDGGIFKSKGEHVVVNTIDVPVLDEYLNKVKECGGQQVTDKVTIPGVGDLAYCKDVEGNLFGILQPAQM